MAEKLWEKIKIRHCDLAGCDVALEAQTVYPAEIMPDQPPRILSHRCSNGYGCALNHRGSCVWSGTNPAYDPFQE